MTIKLGVSIPVMTYPKHMNLQSLNVLFGEILSKQNIYLQFWVPNWKVFLGTEHLFWSKWFDVSQCWTFVAIDNPLFPPLEFQNSCSLFTVKTYYKRVFYGGKGSFYGFKKEKGGRRYIYLKFFETQ